MPYPKLTFFCELDSPHLGELFQEKVLLDLKQLKASVSLGMVDFSPKRAATVRRLNQAGIPVIAWLLLPKDQGYWFNLDNAVQALARYHEFKMWSDENELQWAGIGLDIEPDINELIQIAKKSWKLIPGLTRRLFDHKKYRSGRDAYLVLLNDIRSDGFRVDGYQFPVIADERKAGSTLLQQAAGLVDIPVDREVWMLYTSFVRPYGAGLVASYSPEAQSVGLGSTGGGVDFGIDGQDALTWDEFGRDLRLAWHWCDDLHIFSLEGCVQQGFLERMKTFEWDRPMMVPESDAARANAFRSGLRTILWLGSRIRALLIAWALLLIFSRGIKKARELQRLNHAK